MNTTTKRILRLTALLFAAAWIAAVSLAPLWRMRRAFNEGKEYRFRITPVGVEPVKGGYLRFVMPYRVRGDFADGGRACAVIGTRPDGRSFWQGFSPLPPENQPYLNVVRRSRWSNNAITPPFDAVWLGTQEPAVREKLRKAIQHDRLQLRIAVKDGDCAVRGIVFDEP